VDQPGVSILDTRIVLLVYSRLNRRRQSLGDPVVIIILLHVPAIAPRNAMLFRWILLPGSSHENLVFQWHC
jgi:hypothetical protein